jgi:hypothetical protein
LDVPGPERAAEMGRALPFDERVEIGGIDHGFAWDQYLAAPDTNRLGICCSGGGIRSASYCLGGLQALRWTGHLAEAAHLSCVSGGGYISIAHTVLVSASLGPPKSNATMPREAELFDKLPPWGPSSPEEQHLRDHTTYLASGVGGKVWFALNLLYGIVRHLVPFAAALFVAATVTGIALERWLGPSLRGPRRTVSFAGPWLAVGALGLLAGLLLVARQIAQGRAQPDGRVLAALQRSVLRAVTVQTVVAALVLALPALLLLIHERPGYIPHNPGSVGGAESGAAVLVGVARYLYRRGIVTRVLPLLASVVGPLTLGVPFVAVTYWVAQHRPPPRLAVVLAIAAVVLLAIYAFLDEATANMHLFYRERLATAFVGRRAQDVDGDDFVYAQPPWKEPVWFSETHEGSTTAKLPNLVVCSAVNLSRDVPPGRLAASFTFERDFSGSPLTGYVRTRDLEGWAGGSVLTLPAMMAISGAAVAPSMGKMTRPWLRLLLAMFDVRLGVWLPNPLKREPMSAAQVRHATEGADAPAGARPPRVGSRLRRPGLLYVLREALGQNTLDHDFVYVSDGGHWENLGLVELLRRGCGQIICFDAAGDDLSHFHTLSEAIALARSDLGVWIDIDVSDLRPTTSGPDAGTSSKSHVVGTITYPDFTTGVLIFVKAAIARDTPEDVKSYRERDKKFPTHPTSDQLFNDERFEAYRALGARSAVGAITALNEWRNNR